MTNGLPNLGQCPICLQTISLSDEAFLENCFHRFCFQCIKEWSKVRPHGGGRGDTVTCPTCRTPYTFILYDCVQGTYSQYNVGGTGAGRGPRDNPSVTLTAAQRRRRSVYFTSLSPTPEGLPGPHSLPRDLQRWVQRELQALTLEQDVDLIAQHVLGVLRHELAPANLRDKAKSRMESACNSTTQVAAAVASAAEPYVFEHAALFAAEVLRFACAGLSLEAYDRIVFGLEEPSQNEEAERHAQQSLQEQQQRQQRDETESKDTDDLEVMDGQAASFGSPSRSEEDLEGLVAGGQHSAPESYSLSQLVVWHRKLHVLCCVLCMYCAVYYACTVLCTVHVQCTQVQCLVRCRIHPHTNETGTWIPVHSNVTAAMQIFDRHALHLQEVVQFNRLQDILSPPPE
eukprot:jgi/Botrbrau1/17715/Bobra.0166s0137.1